MVSLVVSIRCLSKNQSATSADDGLGRPLTVSARGPDPGQVSLFGMRLVAPVRLFHNLCRERYPYNAPQNGHELEGGAGVGENDMTPVWFDVVRQFDWQGALRVALPSGVISSIVAIGWNSCRDHRDHRRERRNAALEVALSLEKYVRTCRAMMHRADWASKDAIRTNREQPVHGVQVPDFTYPAVEWKWLHHKMTSVLRDFPATVHYAREYIATTGEFAPVPDVCDELAFECAKLAKRALELSRLTRRKHGAAPWHPGAAETELERELYEFVAARESSRKTMLEQPTSPTTPASSACDRRALV
ncbi:hypothetical protein [Paraburkholderia sp. BR14374]|uniref:hypothetical protein n=1 Tax=Paraburkholderia sp. BR14374 TaxID=3237007 RepID=UPI0034CF57F3